MLKFYLPGFSNRLLVRRNAVLSNLLPPLNAVRTKQYIDLAKPKSGACIFFFRTSQGHNALPRPGLGPGSSDSEPSALITGLLDYWTTGQSRGVGVPAVQLTTHVKSSTLYGRTVVHPNFFGLMGYYYYFV